MTARTCDGLDADTIAAQLGRPPRGDVAVVVRCSKGAPQVIRTSSALPDGSPFPTLFWLTCPALSRAVAKLEGGGLIAEIQGRVDADSPLSAQLAASSRSYVREREGTAGIRRSENCVPGIGGVADPGAVKCLHAHYAHYMATGENPIGRIVSGIIDEIDPDMEPICENCRV